MYREFNFDYQPTDIGDEVFLSEIPFSLLKKSIKSQFNDPLEYRKKDYVQSFITQYEFSKNDAYDYEDQKLDDFHEEFIAYMNEIFEAYLSVGFPDIEEKTEDEQHEIIHLTYRFFIKNIKKNFITLIMNYIDKYKLELASSLPKKKDVTSLNLKAEIDNEEDIIIISNLNEVIDDILSIDFSVEEFLELCTDKGNCLETEFIKDSYNNYVITGNFVEEYEKMVDSYFKTELESKVRNKILKKYPKRKSDEKIDEELENDESEK